MNKVAITLENAQELLIDESFKRPVAINFWAASQAPCIAFNALLEKLADEFDGSFLLANVDAAQLAMVASQFGVRSLPTVMLMKNGQPIDGFAGVVAEVQVRELLQKYLPAPWEKAVHEAQSLMMAADFAAALPLLRKAYESSKQEAGIAFLLVQCHLGLNRTDNAEAVLSTIKPADQNEAYAQLLVDIAEKKQAAKSQEVVALEAALEAAPEDLQRRFQLALQYQKEQSYRQALELLIVLLRKDLQFAEGAAREIYKDILLTLGKGDALAIEFQRKLFAILY
jgi:putative thioredoxin